MARQAKSSHRQRRAVLIVCIAALTLTLGPPSSAAPGIVYVTKDVGDCGIGLYMDGQSWDFKAHFAPDDIITCTSQVRYRYTFWVIKASGLLTNWTDYEVKKKPTDGGFSHLVSALPDWHPTIFVGEEGTFKGRLRLQVKDAAGALWEYEEETEPKECEIRSPNWMSGCFIGLPPLRP